MATTSNRAHSAAAQSILWSYYYSLQAKMAQFFQTLYVRKKVHGTKPFNIIDQLHKSWSSAG
jgi:hypothetical protein